MKVLLMEPKAIARSHLREMVRELSQDIEVFEAGDGESALHVLGCHSDLGLIVAEFPMARAAGLLSNKDREPGSSRGKLVVLSASPCHPELWAAVEHGAMAYVPKTEPRAIMLAALQIVIGGGRYFPPDLLVGRRYNDWEAHPSVRSNLTSRQAEVLAHMAAGKSNKTIARELGMSTGTVKVHVTAILKALNVSNRTEAVISTQRGDLRRRSQMSRPMDFDVPRVASSSRIVRSVSE
jgi:DNA-binding NarL/FixJ family response regulator